jgi:hypothetical protein
MKKSAEVRKIDYFYVFNLQKTTLTWTNEGNIKIAKMTNCIGDTIL